jgi:superfamily II DNA/RNA helicase
MDQRERDEAARQGAWRDSSRTETLHLECRRQFYVDCESDEWKLEALMDLLEVIGAAGQLVVFCSGRTRANWLSERLTADGWRVSTVLDESADGSERRAFMVGETMILVTTDCGPGLADLHGAASAINFDLPGDNVDYIRRVGGCGKFGRRGLVINLVTKDDHHRVGELEAYFNTEIATLPSTFADFV